MDKYAELRAAIDAGPTPGPWRHTTYMSGTQNVEFPGARGVTFVDEVLDADARAICSDNDTKPFPWIDVSHRPEDSGDDIDPQRTRNARYIAACHPEVIRALLADHDTYRRQDQHETDVAHAAFERVKALEAERDALREALTECLRVNETDAGSDVAVWANAMLVARAALSQGQGEA